MGGLARMKPGKNPRKAAQSAQSTVKVGIAVNEFSAFDKPS
jgi:hypothetical protein